MFLEKTRTFENVRNAVISGNCGQSKGIGGKRFFVLLSDKPWVRIPPGSPFCLPDLTDLPPKGGHEDGRFFLFYAESKKSANGGWHPTYWQRY